jgi:hypothetical protein
MNLTYQATLEDISEPAIRHYLRSQSAKKNRRQSTVIGMVICAAAAAFVFRDSEGTKLLFFTIIGAITGGVLNFYTYKSTVKKRITKHMRLETEGRLPSQTTYRIQENELICDCLGATITFQILDLAEIKEDNERMELNFGDVGLCTIPLRAFESAEEKQIFLRELKSEPDASGQRR